MLDGENGVAFGPGDPQQERAIATRRALEVERLKRIKDPKSRIMGIDTEALEEGGIGKGGIENRVNALTRR